MGWYLEQQRDTFPIDSTMTPRLCRGVNFAIATSKRQVYGYGAFMQDDAVTRILIVKPKVSREARNLNLGGNTRAVSVRR